MGELYDSDENLLYQLRAYKVNYKTIDNLNSLKEMILKSSKSDISTLKLYKAFYSNAGKETTNELYFKFFIGLIISFGALKLRDYSSKIKIEGMDDMLFTISVIAITILAVIDTLNQNKKRIELLNDVIDVCIDELEEEEKRKEWSIKNLSWG